LDDPEMYHAHCWEEAGKPQVFTERSNFAPCQGYFIGPNDLNKDYPIDGGWKFIKDCLIHLFFTFVRSNKRVNAS